MKRIFAIYLAAQCAGVFAENILPFRVKSLEPKTTRPYVANPDGLVLITKPKLTKEEQIAQYLRKSNEFYVDGRYDLAWRYCDRALSVAPQNISLHKRLRKITNARALVDLEIARKAAMAEQREAILQDNARQPKHAPLFYPIYRSQSP